jgi:hypothetical protein
MLLDGQSRVSSISRTLLEGPLVLSVLNPVGLIGKYSG